MSINKDEGASNSTETRANTRSTVLSRFYQKYDPYNAGEEIVNITVDPDDTAVSVLVDNVESEIKDSILRSYNSDSNILTNGICGVSLPGTFMMCQNEEEYDKHKYILYFVVARIFKNAMDHCSKNSSMIVRVNERELPLSVILEACKMCVEVIAICKKTFYDKKRAVAKQKDDHNTILYGKLMDNLKLTLSDLTEEGEDTIITNSMKRSFNYDDKTSILDRSLDKVGQKFKEVLVLTHHNLGKKREKGEMRHTEVREFERRLPKFTNSDADYKKEFYLVQFKDNRSARGQNKFKDTLGFAMEYCLSICEGNKNDQTQNILTIREDDAPEVAIKTALQSAQYITEHKEDLERFQGVEYENIAEDEIESWNCMIDAFQQVYNNPMSKQCSWIVNGGHRLWYWLLFFNNLIPFYFQLRGLPGQVVTLFRRDMEGSLLYGDLYERILGITITTIEFPVGTTHEEAAIVTLSSMYSTPATSLDIFKVLLPTVAFGEEIDTHIKKYGAEFLFGSDDGNIVRCFQKNYKYSLNDPAHLSGLFFTIFILTNVDAEIMRNLSKTRVTVHMGKTKREAIQNMSAYGINGFSSGSFPDPILLARDLNLICVPGGSPGDKVDSFIEEYVNKKMRASGCNDIDKTAFLEVSWKRIKRAMEIFLLLLQEDVTTASLKPAAEFPVHTGSVAGVRRRPGRPRSAPKPKKITMSCAMRGAISIVSMCGENVNDVISLDDAMAFFEDCRCIKKLNFFEDGQARMTSRITCRIEMLFKKWRTRLCFCLSDYDGSGENRDNYEILDSKTFATHFPADCRDNLSVLTVSQLNVIGDWLYECHEEERDLLRIDKNNFQDVVNKVTALPLEVGSSGAVLGGFYARFCATETKKKTLIMTSNDDGCKYWELRSRFNAAAYYQKLEVMEIKTPEKNPTSAARDAKTDSVGGVASTKKRSHKAAKDGGAGGAASKRSKNISASRERNEPKMQAASSSGTSVVARHSVGGKGPMGVLRANENTDAQKFSSTSSSEGDSHSDSGILKKSGQRKATGSSSSSDLSSSSSESDSDSD